MDMKQFHDENSKPLLVANNSLQSLVKSSTESSAEKIVLTSKKVPFKVSKIRNTRVSSSLRNNRIEASHKNYPTDSIHYDTSVPPLNMNTDLPQGGFHRRCASLPISVPVDTPESAPINKARRGSRDFESINLQSSQRTKPNLDHIGTQTHKNTTFPLSLQQHQETNSYTTSIPPAPPVEGFEDVNDTSVSSLVRRMAMLRTALGSERRIRENVEESLEVEKKLHQDALRANAQLSQPPVISTELSNEEKASASAILSVFEKLDSADREILEAEHAKQVIEISKLRWHHRKLLELSQAEKQRVAGQGEKIVEGQKDLENMKQRCAKFRSQCVQLLSLLEESRKDASESDIKIEQVLKKQQKSDLLVEELTNNLSIRENELRESVKKQEYLLKFIEKLSEGVLNERAKREALEMHIRRMNVYQILPDLPPIKSRVVVKKIPSSGALIFNIFNGFEEISCDMGQVKNVSLSSQDKFSLSIGTNVFKFQSPNSTEYVDSIRELLEAVQDI